MQKALVIFCFLLLFFFSKIALAQYDAPELLYEDGNDLLGIIDIKVADVDGDAIPDIIIAAPDNNRISWYKNYGSGSFSAERIVSTNAMGVRSIFIADMNGDFIPDILAANKGINQITWYENDGMGHFGVPNYFTYLSGVDHLQAADIDGDGDNDVVGSSSQGGAIIWIPNLGSGIFFSETVLTSNAINCEKVETVDYDQDGDLDIIAASGNNHQIMVFKNIGSGNFDNVQFLNSGRQIENTFNVSDIDGDSDLDVVVLHQGENIDNDPSQVIYFENDDHVLKDSAIAAASYSIRGIESLLLDDMDNDGLLDILIASTQYSFGQLSILTNAGNASFNDLQEVTGHDLTGIAISTADINGDQNNDLIFSNKNQLLWLDHFQFVEPDGNEWMNSIGDSSSNSRMTSHFMFADNNGDGEQDILFSTRVGSNQTFRFSHLQGSEDGNFGPPIGLLSDINQYGDKSFFIADINGDEHMDLVQEYNEAGVIQYFGSANGTFDIAGITTQIGVVEQLTISELVDLNSDGYPDLLCIGRIGENEYPYLLLNNGEGLFDSIQQLSDIPHTQNSRMHIESGDINNDGKLDIVGVAIDGDLTSFYMLNLDGASFDTLTTQSHSVSLGWFPIANLDLADLDGDGDEELFIRFYTLVSPIGCGHFCPVLQTDKKYLIYDFVGNEFAELNQFNFFPFGGYGYSGLDFDIGYGDYNQDGNIDLLTIGSNMTSIEWLLGDGQGFFPETIVVEEDLIVDNSDFVKLLFSDVDHDQDLDVILLRTDLDALSNSLHLYKNLEPLLDLDNDGYDIIVDCDDDNSDIGDHLPEAELGPDLEVCEGQALQFSVNNLLAGATYQWNGPSEYSSLSSEPLISPIELAHSGTYSLVMSLNDCVSEPASVDITVHPISEVIIEQIGDILTSTGTNIVSYQWYQSGTPIATATSSTFEVNSSGDYHVVAIDGNGCLSVSETISVVINSVNDHFGESGIRYRPNPIDDLLFIEIGTFDGPLAYRILNPLGQTVRSGTLRESNSTLDLSKIDAGLYFMEIVKNRSIHTFELVVNR